MTRLKYRDPADGLYKLLPVGGGGGSEEVVISAGVAPALNEELWVDLSEVGPIYDWSYADNRYLLNGFRNAVRNGDMSIAQRGNGPFTSGYTVDGWFPVFVGGAVSITRTPASAGGSALLVTAVSGQTATSHYADIRQYIEDVNTLNGKTVTLSFLAKAASGTPQMAVMLSQMFGTGGSSSVTTAVQVVTLSSTLTRYSATFVLPSTAGKTIGADDSQLRVIFRLSSGTDYTSGGIPLQNNTFTLTEVQLEEGAAKTPFERLPQQQQLAWCQRYFWHHQADVDPDTAWVGHCISATAVYAPVKYPVTMRAVPTVVNTATWLTRSATGSGTTVSGFSAPTNASQEGLTLIATTTGMVAGNASELMLRSNGFSASAEL